MLCYKEGSSLSWFQLSPAHFIPGEHMHPLPPSLLTGGRLWFTEPRPVGSYLVTDGRLELGLQEAEADNWQDTEDHAEQDGQPHRWLVQSVPCRAWPGRMWTGMGHTEGALSPTAIWAG